MSGADLGEFSMRDLFRVEAEAQAQALTAGLLALEQNPGRADQLEACMRAAHSLKGAARIVDIGAGVTLAHAMEELFVAAQEGRTVLSQRQIDLLLKGVDLLTSVANAETTAAGEFDPWEEEADRYVAELAAMLKHPAPESGDAGDLALARDADVAETKSSAPQPELTSSERALRVSAGNLNRLLDLAGESLVESRRLKPFARSLLQLKRLHRQAAKAIEDLHAALPADALGGEARSALTSAARHIHASRQLLAEQMAALEASDHHAATLAHRLYDQALMVRMRPFADGVTAFPRMARDVGRSLGKSVRLEIGGGATQVDRDILERLDAPLGHLVRNAVDHGIENPDTRIAAGKPPEGLVRLEAHHVAGNLQIQIVDDGRGIDVERLRRTVIERKLAPADTAGQLSEAELLDFLFLPGFTMKDGVTEISGRGVGLDVVHDMVKQVGGIVRVSSVPGQGTRFLLQLPLTLSVIRALLVDIAGEPYAFSFAHIVRALKVPREAVGTIEGRQHFELDGRRIALVSARQILESGSPAADAEALSIVVIGAQQSLYGVVVDGFLGGRELVVQPLDARLGKVKDINAGALMDDGSPLLILDVEDMVRSIEKLAVSDRLDNVRGEPQAHDHRERQRILVVDDSFTVRELQRKLLDHHGYQVEVAVDGIDGWNAVRAGRFDLVVTDIDMPRMDGIQLVTQIKKDPNLHDLPVMILSYKDREDDRRRGLEAGADYYLTKGSYQSDELIEAVVDLIGEAAR
jgi:two-component system sensor histidine kinase and response regulator WspE